MTDIRQYTDRPGKSLPVVFVLAIACGLGVHSAQADPGHDDFHHRWPERHREFVRPPPHYVFDHRFHHDHYYPAPGLVVNALPPGYLDIGVRRGHFFFNAGIWYRPVGSRFVVAVPPPGVFVPVLPPVYTTVWVGSIPYYYANNVYYTAAPGGYTVALPPADDSIVTSPPADSAPPTYVEQPPAPASVSPPDTTDTLFVYPANGQSDAQTRRDRSECQRWAVRQTGFDTQRGGPGAQQQNYRHAESACLEGRGYTVK